MIVFLSPLDYRTGYGIDAVQKMMGMIIRGYEVFVRSTRMIDHISSTIPIELDKRRIFRPTNATPWEILISPPCRMLPTPGKKTVMITTFETDRTPKGFMEYIAPRTEAIIVPCQWNKDTLLNAGYSKPIFVCPQSVDSRFTPEIPWRKQPFTFGSVCCPLRGDGDRKGIQDLVCAFENLWLPFDETAILKLKISDHSVMPRLKFNPNVQVIQEDFSVEKMVEFYHSMDCYVSASSGEAWGRCLHEAMACARPCIATKFGGHAEFFDSSCGYVVRAIHEQTGGSYSFGDWGRPDIHELCDSMKKAFNASWPTRMLQGYWASSNAKRFSQEVCAKHLESILLEIGVIEPKKVRRPQKGAPEDLVRAFYEDKESIPKPPCPIIKGPMTGLTNDPSGIGDIAILTAVSKVWSDMGSSRQIFQDSTAFRLLAPRAFNAAQEKPEKLMSAWRLQRQYDLGNGHFTQRLQRAFGLKPSLVPKPILKGVAGATKFSMKNEKCVVVHINPGSHAAWQRRVIHRRAREVYPENIVAIDKFIKSRGLIAYQVGGGPRIPSAIDMNDCPIEETMNLMEASEYFIGIMSGPMHLATAFDCKCIVLINFPDPNQIFLPVLKDIPLVESEWFYPQHVYLHEDAEGPLVKKFSPKNLARAFDGELYPYWKQTNLHMINP